MSPSRLAFLIAATIAAPVQAQHHAHTPTAPSSGYPAALTTEEAEGLLDGRGLAMALAAEANHYPGPLHVLELADALALSDDQRAEAERLRAAMRAEAIPLGEQIVEVERNLDALFASGEATSDAVDRMTAHIARLRGQLRAVHLRAHLAMRAALSAAQIAAYDRLRAH